MSAADTPASASAPCATSTISDSTSRPSCLPNFVCAQPTMHPVIMISSAKTHPDIGSHIMQLPNPLPPKAEASRARCDDAVFARVILYLLIDPIPVHGESRSRLVLPIQMHIAISAKFSIIDK